MSEKRPPICDYEGSDYQTTFWEEGDRDYEDGAERVALQRMLPAAGTLLLEVGAGAGRNTPRYQNFEHIVLLDYSLTQLQQAQERLGKNSRYTYVAGDVYRLPFVPSLFDCATMIRTIHHLAEPRLALDQIRRVLHAQAVFILEFPNKKNLKAIGRYFLGRQTWNPFSPEPVEFAELHFDYHPRTMREWLGESQFHIERQLTVSHFRLGFLKRVVPTRLLVFLDSVCQLTGNWWQLSPSIFVRSRAVGEQPAAEQPSDFFRCLECGSSALQEDQDQLSCSECGSTWPIRSGIYDFRDQA